MDISIIIVNYNTKKLLKQTIDSVFKYQTNLNYEIIVSDNGSTDGSIEMVKSEFADVQLIENNANLGFSKANNLAIKQAKGRYILLLNSDTMVAENCLDKCLAYMDKHLDIGVLGCKILLPNGELDLACRRSFPTPKVSFYRMTGLSKIFPKSRVFGQYNLTYLDEDSIYEVDSIVGAFMMVRREVIKQVGFLDEDYFMYGEDIDWCYRIKYVGWKIVYYPEAQIMHYKGASGGGRNPKIIKEFYRAMRLFYDKHYKKNYSLFTTAFIYLGIFSKMGISLFINQLKLSGGQKQ